MRPRINRDDRGKVYRFHVVPSACGKYAYSSKKDAAAQAKRQSRESGEDIRYYKCDRGCHAWHIGHPPRDTVGENLDTDRGQ